MGCKPNSLLLATSPTIGFRDADAWMPAYIHTIDQSPTFWAGVENEKKRRFMRQVERVRHAWEFCKFFNFPSVFQSSLYTLADPRAYPRPQTPDRIRYISFRLVYPVSELFLQGLRRMASLLWLFVAQFLEVASKRLLPHAQLLGSEKASNILTLMTSTAVNLVYGYALFPSVNENIYLWFLSNLIWRLRSKQFR